MKRPKKQLNRPAELRRYERDLPSVTEFALLAAILGPREEPNEAFARAAKLHSLAAEFHDAYTKSSPEDRAFVCGDSLALSAALDAKLAPSFPKVPPPPKDHFPTYSDFLSRVVKAKTPADSQKRMRDFFRSECPPGRGADEFALDRIKAWKREGFSSPAKWVKLATDYLFWHRKQVADQNSKNRKGKTKKPLASA